MHFRCPILTPYKVVQFMVNNESKRPKTPCMFWEKGPLGEKAPGSQKDTPGHHGTAAFWPAYFRISLNILATNDCHMVSGGLLELSQYNIGSIYSWKFDSIPAISVI